MPLTINNLVGIGAFNEAAVAANNFLDLTAATVFCAYSTRKLRAAYAGSALRVRRSSDNAEINIGFVGEDLDTATMLAHCGAGDGFVRTFFDQGPSGLDMEEIDSGNQPKLVAGGVLLSQNGKATVDFTGMKFLGRASVAWTSAPLCCFFIVKIVSAAYNAIFSIQPSLVSGSGIAIWPYLGPGSGIVDAPSGGAAAYGDGYLDTQVPNVTLTATADYDDGVYSQSDLFLSSGAADWFKNGVAATEQDEDIGADPASITDTMRLGQFSPGSGDHLNPELVVFSTDPGVDRATLRTNAKTYWGTP